MNRDVPCVRDLVLLGGGHSHVQVLKRFGMRPLPGVRLTVVSRDFDTPYSGMLPGYVAGAYSFADIHIDLGPLARFCGARLIRASALAIDPDARVIELSGRPDLRYDVLSINTGAEPGAGGAGAVPVKPIGGFLPHWQRVRDEVTRGDRIVVVGGGAGGVELALAMRRSLPQGVHVEIVTSTLLDSHNRGVARRARLALAQAGVQITEGVTVAGVDEAGVRLNGSGNIAARFVFWVTGVDAPQWTRRSGLGLDDGGFIEVTGTLQSVSHDNVFAAGDIASMRESPRPKSGVFAVRQGPVLADNLRRYLREEPLRRFRPQREFLSLIGTGDESAIVSRGPLAAAGPWAWRWKDWIDRRFMARFKALPEMPDAATPGLPASLARDMPQDMRCGGCGSKLAAQPLSRALSRLALTPSARVEQGIGDDAAIVRGTHGRMVLTVDGFRAMVDDPYLFGRIAAHHSLNDVLAMGARPVSALAVVTVPVMAERMMEDELFWVLKGGVDVFADFDVDLVGGHSAEGAELTLSFTITGELDGPVLGKGPLVPGDRLLLTKPVGTGVVLAADMRGKASSHARAAVLEHMDTSNAAALAAARRHGARAATDVTGFGLLGHLAEMLRTGDAGVDLHIDAVPLLPGAAALLSDGFQSSLQASNEWVLADFEILGRAPTDPALRLLVDPQTSGGLLLAMPPETSAACLADLRCSGCIAAEIGEVTASGWRLLS